MGLIPIVKIRNMHYDVNTVDYTVLNGQLCYGLIDYNKLEIQIAKDIPLEKQRETLWHEILHGITNEYNIDLSNDDEEDIIDEISKGIVQVLHDNPELIR